MDRDIDDFTIVEEGIFVIDIQDDQLERLSGSGERAVTWGYCTAIWYGCPA